MGMTIEQAEKLLDDLATQEEFLCKRADDASGYTRSGNESIRTSNAKTHEQHAKEYRQILRYLAEYRLMQSDYENRLKADMVAMLTDIQLEIADNIESIIGHYDASTPERKRPLCKSARNEGRTECIDFIQQKINALKEQNNEANS